MYVLDTNVVSELRRRRPHGAVFSWLESVPQSDLHVSAVSIAELQQGVEITRRQDLVRAGELEAWLDREVLAVFHVLSFDTAAAREWARLMQGSSNTLLLDAMIAATAIVHGFQIVTRDVHDFAQLGVAVFNPFEYSG